MERAYLYQQYALFAVFDGHNGQVSADALQTGLHVAVGKQSVFHQAPEKVRVTLSVGLCTFHDGGTACRRV